MKTLSLTESTSAGNSGPGPVTKESTPQLPAFYLNPHTNVLTTGLIVTRDPRLDLLFSYKADLNAKTRQGQLTPLMLSVLGSKSREAQLWLLEHGADRSVSRDKIMNIGAQNAAWADLERLLEEVDTAWCRGEWEPGMTWGSGVKRDVPA